MKLLLIFTLLTQFSMAQVGYFMKEVKNGPVDSLILGDWYLNQIDVVDGYNEYADSNRFTSDFSREKKITFTKDSLINYRDKTLRYYTHVEDYAYRVEYDSLFSRNEIKLFSGKKRKQREVESYQIVHCSESELVIKSYQSFYYGLDAGSFSIIYVYRREKVSELAEKIQGDWFFCSEEDDLLLLDSDTLSYEFSRSSNELECDDRVRISFNMKKYVNVLNYRKFSREYTREYSLVVEDMCDPISYSLDSEKGLLIMNTAKPFVYTISIKDETLTLSLNKEKTDEMRTKKNMD